jgi:hypothetical protein
VGDGVGDGVGVGVGVAVGVGVRVGVAVGDGVREGEGVGDGVAELIGVKLGAVTTTPGPLLVTGMLFFVSSAPQATQSAIPATGAASHRNIPADEPMFRASPAGLVSCSTLRSSGTTRNHLSRTCAALSAAAIMMREVVMAEQEIWDLWFPNAGAQGLPFGRGRMDHVDAALVHAAPQSLRVEVRDDAGRLLAYGDQLQRTADRPMARLRRTGASITREDLWPAAEDIGRPVILAGGEIGILRAWWNAEDGSEWRWQLEFYNHR